MKGITCIFYKKSLVVKSLLIFFKKKFKIYVTLLASWIQYFS